MDENECENDLRSWGFVYTNRQSHLFQYCLKISWKQSCCAVSACDSKMSKDNDGHLGGKCKQTQILTVITARKRSCVKVMFLHLSVILFGGGGACHEVTSCYGTPKYGTSRTAPPYGQQVVRILLGCFLGSALFSHRKTANIKKKISASLSPSVNEPSVRLYLLPSWQVWTPTQPGIRISLLYRLSVS